MPTLCRKAFGFAASSTFSYAKTVYMYDGVFGSNTRLPVRLPPWEAASPTGDVS